VQFVPTGTISATTVQSALAELDSETQTTLAGKAPSAASTGAGTSFPPSGSIGASNVTAAIQELDTEVYAALALKATTVQLDAATKGPAFSASASTNQIIAVGAWTKLAFDAEVFDTNTNYVPATARFTPSVAGYYQVNCSAKIDEIGVGSFGANLSIDKNSSLDVAVGIGVGDDGYKTGFSTSGLVYMNGTTDYLEAFVQPLGLSGSLTILGVNFSAFLARPA